MQIKREIFKEYDIRGKYPHEINEKTAYSVARALISFLKLKRGKVVLGRDKRQSSLKLAQGALNGVIGAGIDVIDVGMVTTPELDFACCFLKTDAGIIITASHNPLNYNGIKLMKKNAEPIGGKEIQKIYEIAKRQS